MTIGFGISSKGTGDVTIAMDFGVPHSTARGCLGKAPKVVVSLDVTDLKDRNSAKKSSSSRYA